MVRRESYAKEALLHVIRDYVLRLLLGKAAKVRLCVYLCMYFEKKSLISQAGLKLVPS